MENIPEPPLDVVDLDSDSDGAEPSEAGSMSDNDDIDSTAANDDSLVGSSDFANTLLDALEGISSEQTGTFAHAAPISDAVFKDPKIHVDGIGRIPLPLSVEHAEKLMALSRQGEMLPGSFRLANPLWEQRALPALVNRVVKELGVEGEVDGIGAQVRNMQLHQTEMKIVIKDQEKTPGLIGRLVVCLPSWHSGGAVHAKLGSITKELESLENKPSFMCWYHDVEHQIEDIFSGYRWTLVYDLINFEQPDLTASASRISAQTDSLHEIFKNWKQHPDHLASRYIYVLENDYEGTDLSFNVLYGGDLSVARALKEIIHEVGFTIFLARIECRKTGTLGVYDYGGYPYIESDLDEMEEVEKEALRLEEVMDLSGRSLVKNIPVSEEEVLRDDWTDHVHPKQEEIEGNRADHVFQNAAIVIMSNQETMSFLVHGHCPPDAMMDYLSQQNFDSPDDPRIIRQFKDFLLRASADVKVHGDNLGTLDSIIESCISLKDADLFNSIASPVKWPLSSKTLDRLSHWVWESGFRPLQAGLEQLIPNNCVIFETNEFLRELVGAQTYEGFDPKIAVDSGLSDFVEAKIQEVLDKAPKLFLEDCMALIQILDRTQSFQQISAKLLNVVERNATNTPVVLQFLNELLRKTARFPEGFVPETFRTLFKSMAPLFSLRHDPYQFRKIQPPPEGPEYSWMFSLDPGSTLWTLRPGKRHVPDYEWHILASVITSALRWGLEDETVPILQQLMAECNLTQHRDAETMLLPFTKILPQKMKQEGLETVDKFPRLLEFYQTFVTAHFNRFVGTEPLFDWARPPGIPGERDKDLHIEDCGHLNEFLQSPYYTMACFKLPQYRQKKLLRYIPGEADTGCSTNAKGYLVLQKYTVQWSAKRRHWAGDCEAFLRNVKSLEQIMDLKSVLGEIYARVVQHAEAKAREPVDGDRVGGVPPHRCYEWDGQPKPRPPPSGLQPPPSEPLPIVPNNQAMFAPERYALPPLYAASGPHIPFDPTSGNAIPTSGTLTVGMKRKAETGGASSEVSREVVRRKSEGAVVSDLMEE